jgi:hypothetical protein
MLLAAGVPDHIGWMRAAAHHVYLWNRTHVSARTGVTPYEAVTQREPSILHVGVFGCDAFVHQDRTQRSVTFSTKAEPGIYLGHDAQQNCAVVRMLHAGKTIRARDVIFREGSFAHMRAEREQRADKVQSLDLAGLEDERQSGAQAAPDAEAEREAEPDSDEEDGLGASDDDASSAAEAPTAESSPQKYIVKAITSHRTTGSGATEYHVKWQGYRAQTWEPESVMREDAPDAVREYQQFLDRRSAARVTRSRAASSSSSSSTQGGAPVAQHSQTLQTQSAAAQSAAAPDVPVPAVSGNSNGASSDAEEEKESDPTMAARDVAAQRL